jgi:hypothetical protein
MMWPPSWQDGKQVPIEEITSYYVSADPVMKDPVTGRSVNNIKSWLTDQAYVGGTGEEYARSGQIANPECNETNFCGWNKVPWASPGRSPSLGGGCGIFGGNPDGCPAHNDTRPAGSKCGQYKRNRGTFAFGSSALDMDFPQAATTVMELGSWQDVAWVSNGGHWGGYTYRLCKLPPSGKKGITEKCFAKNVLKFATKYTTMRFVAQPGKWWKIEEKDLKEGTYPHGSVWRRVMGRSTEDNGLLRKDTVVIPAHLPEGDYVMSFRWDTKDPQIWVSCANVRLVKKGHGGNVDGNGMDDSKWN